MTAQEYDCATQPESCATPAPVPSEERVVDQGTVPPVTPTGATNGWIAYSTDPAVVVTEPPTESGFGGPATTGSDLYLVRVGGDPILVADRASETTWNACPAFSPDGGLLAFGVASGSERAMVVRTMGPDGVVGDPIRISVPTSEAIPCPQWSSDGRRLGYLDGSTVRMFAPDGSAAEAAHGDPLAADFVTSLTESERSLLRIPSPSGDRTVRLDSALDCELVLETPDQANVEVLLLGAGLGERHVQPSIGCPYAIAGWSPDGRSVLVMQDISGRDFAMHAVQIEAPYTLTTIVAPVRTNSARSWSGYGDVAWQPVTP